MKKVRECNFGVLTSVCVIVCLLAGCQKRDIYDPGSVEKLPVFDFSTKATYTLNLKYTVPEGYNVYFEVYAEQPFSYDENGQKVQKAGLEAIDKGYTDANGVYSNPINLPAYVQQVYIYTPNAGVPQLLVAKVSNGVLLPATLPVAQSKAATKAGISMPGVNLGDVYEYPGIQTVLLGKWGHSSNSIKIPNIEDYILWDGAARIWGRPDYLQFVEQNSFPDASKSSALKVDATIWNTINTVLPGEGYGEVNSKVLKNGDIHVTKDAEVDLYLLDEQCLYLNTLAYYCYPTGQAPASPADIKVQTIAFPDAKIIKTHVNDKFGGTWNYGAMLSGEGIRLHYIDAEGNDKGTKFPAGTSIGWILYSDGYKRVLGAPETGKLTVGEGAVYSNPNLMGGIPHVAVFRHGDFVVTSFEDGKKMNASDKRDFKDVICHIASTPADAITPEVPDLDPDKPADDVVVSTVTRQGILTFEDNWPYRGDFDMNDVVVKYVSTVGYNCNNEVLESTDQFTPINDGAAYSNGFGYENSNMAAGKGKVTFSNGDGQSAVDGNIIRLFKNAKLAQKMTFTVYTKYAQPIAKKNYIPAPYNPFIAVNGDLTKEVHLSNFVPTSYANLAMLGYGHDYSRPESNYYYITYNNDGQQMPFAIDIAFASEKDINTFVIPRETFNISVYYPSFLNWISSGGKEDSDWYLRPSKDK